MLLVQCGNQMNKQDKCNQLFVLFLYFELQILHLDMAFFIFYLVGAVD